MHHILQEMSPEDMEEALKQGMEAQAGEGEGQEIEMSMEMDESQQGNQGEGEEGWDATFLPDHHLADPRMCESLSGINLPLVQWSRHGNCFAASYALQCLNTAVSERTVPYWHEFTLQSYFSHALRDAYQFQTRQKLDHSTL